MGCGCACFRETKLFDSPDFCELWKFDDSRVRSSMCSDDGAYQTFRFREIASQPSAR
jgi:hypothetical protein